MYLVQVICVCVESKDNKTTKNSDRLHQHQNFKYIRNINANGSSKATMFIVKDVVFSDAEDDRVPRFGLCLSSICAPVNFTKLF